jgi:hypothetical protein
MTDETTTNLGQGFMEKYKEEAINQFLKDINSDAAIKYIVKLLIFTLPFKPNDGFPDYYAPDKSCIPILGLEDKEGKQYAFFLTKELINSLAVSCVNIQTAPVHKVAELPNLIVTRNGSDK